MKKFLFIFLLIAISTNALASDYVDADFSIGFTSEPSWRGVNPMHTMTKIENTEAIEASFYVGLDGMTLSASGVLGEGGNTLDFGLQRATFNLGFSGYLSDYIIGSLGGVFYYQDKGDEAGMVMENSEVYVGLTADTLLKPSVTVFFNYDQGSGMGDALFYLFSARHAIAINDYFEIIAQAEMGVNQGNRWFGDYTARHHGKGEAKLRYWYNDSITIEPYISHVAPLSEGAKRAGVDKQTNYGIDISYNF